MPAPAPVVVEDLLLAAMLVVGGARMLSLDPGERVARLRFDVETADRVRLAREFRWLADAIESGEPWGNLFESGVLGRIETEYRRLKAMVVTRRQEA